MVDFVVWLIVGAIIGWVASMIMKTRGGLLVDIVVGIVGASIAGFVLSRLFGIGTFNHGNFSLPALVVSLLGAIILLLVVKLIFRGR